MTDAVFSPGISAATLAGTAFAEPIGQQKARFAADVATLLGDSPFFEIHVGGTVVYRASITGTLASTAAGVALPQRFAEPPLISLANALTSDAFMVVRNRTNQTVAVTVPLKAGGGEGFLTASAALNGTTVGTNGVLLVPPASLDAGANPGQSFWSSARTTDAIATSAGNDNEMQIYGLTGYRGNWIDKATVSFGSRWNDAQPGNWGWPSGGWNENWYMTYFEPWGFLFTEEGSTGLGEIEMRNWDFQVKDIDTQRWRRPWGSKVSVRNWAEYYTVSSTGGIGGTGSPAIHRAGTGGGWSIQLGNTAATRHSHFGFIPLHFVERTNINGVKNFDAVIVSCEFRIDPRTVESNPGWKGGMHVGGDPKPTGTGDQMGMPYYIAFANSKVRRATANWQFVTATNVNGVGETLTDRKITAAGFSADPPME